MGWVVYAALSAAAAAATALLAKVGVQDVPSTAATAFRTAVVLALTLAIVWARGERHALVSLSTRSMIFLTLSGVATGISWLAYFRALQLGPVSGVAPIDKLSLPLTIVFAFLLLGEPLSWRLAAGVAMMTIGALLTVR